MADRVQETWGTQRLLSFLFSVFAGLALTLATIGLYGLLAYTTLKRVREIGVRLALGARPSQILTLILSQRNAAPSRRLSHWVGRRNRRLSLFCNVSFRCQGR